MKQRAAELAEKNRGTSKERDLFQEQLTDTRRKLEKVGMYQSPALVSTHERAYMGRPNGSLSGPRRKSRVWKPARIVKRETTMKMMTRWLGYWSSRTSISAKWSVPYLRNNSLDGLCHHVDGLFAAGEVSDSQRVQQERHAPAMRAHLLPRGHRPANRRSHAALPSL